MIPPLFLLIFICGLSRSPDIVSLLTLAATGASTSPDYPSMMAPEHPTHDQHDIERARADLPLTPARAANKAGKCTKPKKTDCDMRLVLVPAHGNEPEEELKVWTRFKKRKGKMEYHFAVFAYCAERMIGQKQGLRRALGKCCWEAPPDHVVNKGEAAVIVHFKNVWQAALDKLSLSERLELSRRIELTRQAGGEAKKKKKEEGAPRRAMEKERKRLEREERKQEREAKKAREKEQIRLERKQAREAEKAREKARNRLEREQAREAEKAQALTAEKEREAKEASSSLRQQLEHVQHVVVSGSAASDYDLIGSTTSLCETFEPLEEDIGLRVDGMLSETHDHILPTLCNNLTLDTDALVKQLNLLEDTSLDSDDLIDVFLSDDMDSVLQANTALPSSVPEQTSRLARSTSAGKRKLSPDISLLHDLDEFDIQPRRKLRSSVP
jgi:hypothetical protein